jgi:hypothetical protein
MPLLTVLRPHLEAVLLHCGEIKRGTDVMDLKWHTFARYYPPFAEAMMHRE